MKCEACLELLEEYLDGEIAAHESSEIAAHLITCVSCSEVSAELGAEREMFLQYDRELEVPASLWDQIAERTVAPTVRPVSRNGFAAWLVSLFRVPAFGFSVATAVALIVLAILISSAYLRMRKPPLNNSTVSKVLPAPQELPDKKEREISAVQSPAIGVVARNQKSKTRRAPEIKRSSLDQSDVLSSDYGYEDIDDRDTAKHLEQTQNLLRSIRNVQVNDGDQEIDVSYDKALSRRLLNENIVLRRDAEMKAKFPTKVLLSDLEPFLIDIANLPDQAKPDDVRAIKERVQKTEIVAALIGYE